MNNGKKFYFLNENLLLNRAILSTKPNARSPRASTFSILSLSHLIKRLFRLFYLLLLIQNFHYTPNSGIDCLIIWFNLSICQKIWEFFYLKGICVRILMFCIGFWFAIINYRSGLIPILLYYHDHYSIITN